MELTVITLVLTRFAVSAYSFLEDDINYFSKRELAAVEEMSNFAEMESLEPELESTGPQDSHQHTRRYVIYRRMPLEYTRCCGGNKSWNETVLGERWESIQSCKDKMMAKSKGKWRKNEIVDPYSCERLQKMKNHHYCCIIKELGAIKEDGTIHVEKATEFFSQAIKADRLKEVAEKAVGKCAKAKNNTPMKEEENLQCSSSGVNFHYCVQKQIIMTCPDDLLQKSEYCLRVKKAFEDMDG